MRAGQKKEEVERAMEDVVPAAGSSSATVTSTATAPASQI
jgi:hypothetical protein